MKMENTGLVSDMPTVLPPGITGEAWLRTIMQYANSLRRQLPDLTIAPFAVVTCQGRKSLLGWMELVARTPHFFFGVLSFHLHCCCAFFVILNLRADSQLLLLTPVCSHVGVQGLFLLLWCSAFLSLSQSLLSPLSLFPLGRVSPLAFGCKSGLWTETHRLTVVLLQPFSRHFHTPSPIASLLRLSLGIALLPLL